MYSHDEIEKSVLDFWKKEQIYQKVKRSRAKGKPFYFMDGPPYANGHIHMGTALNKILKDTTMRTRRMMGYDVFDRPGYDTHGLPIEHQVEKALGLKTKDDIEKYGVKQFTKQCREFATRFIGEMNAEFENLGVWMDWDNPYLTLEDRYIETIWDALKKAYDKKLLYLGSYPVHVCSRCGTGVAFNEIEYGSQTDPAVFVKFPTNEKNTFLLVWTTTPWTLPANVGVMAHPDVEYAYVEVDGETWIMANELVEKRMDAMDKKYKIVKTVKGKKLEGMKYDNPLSPFLAWKMKLERKVVMAPRYVTTTDGTGLVHCAPGHGKEDYDVGVENKLPALSPVTLNGQFTAEAGRYKNMNVRDANTTILEDLKKEGYVAYIEQYKHDYPLCWRCKTPLIMISQPQWFMSINKIKDALIEHNDAVQWNPQWAKARMKAWLTGIGDWPISRERYWGTPLPIWTCECGEIEVIGSIEDLKKRSKRTKIDMHKPEIDEITFSCNCGKKMKRINGVFDVWFDSGVSSWAALDYTTDKEKFKRYWPADFNVEGPDQFRGWWNSQLILSQLTFGKKPFKAINVHGLVLDLGKRKMSKSLGNVVTPQDAIAKFGRDQLRYYLVKSSRGGDFGYNEKEYADVQKALTILMNLTTLVGQLQPAKGKEGFEDAWIKSRYHRMIAEVTKAYEEYKFPVAIEALESFMMHDLSRSYVQLVRERTDEVASLLREIISGVVRLYAPIIPFLSDHLWQNLKDKKSELSVHLALLPTSDKKLISDSVEKEFNSVKSVIERGLAGRDELKIGVRWPLASINVKASFALSKDAQEIIARQLNVKKVTMEKGSQVEISYNAEMTPELEGEGYAREIARKVQSERKTRGLLKTDSINLQLIMDEPLASMIKPHESWIQNKTGSKKISVSTKGKSQIDFQVREKTVGICF